MIIKILATGSKILIYRKKRIRLFIPAERNHIGLNRNTRAQGHKKNSTQQKSGAV